ERSEDSSLEDSLPPTASIKRRRSIAVSKSSTIEQDDASMARKRKPQSSEEPVSRQRLPKRSRAGNVSHGGPSEYPSPMEKPMWKGSKIAKNVLYNGPTPRIVFSNSEV